MEKVSSALKKGDIKKAVEIFKTLSQEEQECFFKKVSLTLTPPSLISVLKRKLHPGKTYEDYHKSWLPSLNEGQDLSHYFPFMTYVMNAQNVMDSSDILSIGFMWGDPMEIYELTKTVGNTEKMRHDAIETVAEKIGPTQVYEFKDLTQLGS
jgi:hypothetical protein